MKAPDQINELDLAGNDVGTGGAYPPLGFQPLWNADLGNGDYYGLYWPYGRENREPVVCDMLHDEWGLEVAFSNTAVFLKYLKVNDSLRGDVEVDDPGFVVQRFHELKPLLQSQPEQAISLLRQICEDFSESAEYWFTLASQLRRVGDHAGAHMAAIRSFASNWVFGMPPQGALKMLQNAKGSVVDPLVENSNLLTLRFGGEKENSNYTILKNCITAYLSSPTPTLGLLLNQNYGYKMLMETVSFQERFGFNVTDWLREHSKLCEEHLGDSRTKLN